MAATRIVEPVGTLELFVDGFADFQIVDGVLRVTGYSEQVTPGQNVIGIASVKLRMTLRTAAHAIGDATTVIGPHLIRELLSGGEKISLS